MAADGRQDRKHFGRIWLWIAIAAVVAAVLLFPRQIRQYASALIGVGGEPGVQTEEGAPSVLSAQTGGLTAGDGNLDVLFIDVGQGDSILIKSPDDRYMLVDAGERANQQAVLNALKDSGVGQLDAIVCTHPHADHIGGMQAVVESDIAFGAVYMPGADGNTPTYENLLTAIEDKGMGVLTVQAGDIIFLGSDTEAEVLGPCREDGENLNNDSIVLKVTYGETSLLLTGDAEAGEWQDMIALAGDKLKADVLKISHHGSSDGTSPEALDAVAPRYAVISLGADNDYGYPHREVERLLADRSVPVYRTDTMGSIRMTSDGTNVWFDREAVYFRE